MSQITFKQFRRVASIVLFIMFIFLLSRMDQREDFSFISDAAYELNGSWILRYNGTEIKDISLPYDIKLKENTKYSISTILPQLEHSQNTLLLRSSMQNMFIYLENKLIYVYQKPETQWFHTPPASLWLTVELPDDYSGKELRIEMSSSVPSFSGVTNPVKLDSKDVLLLDLVKEQFSGLFMSVALFTAGLVLIIVSFFTDSNINSRIIYLGLMSTSSSLWILAESRLMQFLTGNQFILGSLAFIMVPMMAIFFALYIRETVFTQEHFKKVISYFVYALQCLLFMSVLFQMFANIPLIQFMTYNLIVISLGSVVSAYYIIIEVCQYKNETAKRLIRFIIILLISLALEVGSFFLGSFSSISSFFRIGLFVFFLLLISDTIMYIRDSMSRKNETILLEKLAYKDFLTGGLNRTSYERDLERKINSKHSFILNLLDLNYLKHINDNFGHNVGDEAIRIIYRSLELSFKDIGHIYRIGGDEFAVIVDDTNTEKNKKAIDQFHQSLDEINKSFIYPLNVAIGTDVYSGDKWEQFSRFYHHVDQKMYENKSKLKSAD